MEKLTSILAVALDAASTPSVVDKAVTVARHFNARVEVLCHDSTPTRALDGSVSAEVYERVTEHRVPHSRESSYEIVLRTIWTLRPDLVVKAEARDGSDWELAEESPAPVLLVRRKAWDKALRFAAAVDVSDEDNAALPRAILHTAGFLALGTHGHLDILYSEPEAHDEALRMRRAVRLAQLVREFHVGCERLQIFSGAPEKRLPPLVAARRYDVLILGGESPRSGDASQVPESVSSLMDATESDVVLVKASLPSAAITEKRGSGRQQRADQPQEFA